MRESLHIGFCIVVLGVSAALGARGRAAEEGQLMQLTMHVQEHIAGMAALPAHTVSRQICVKAGSFDPKAFAQLQSSAKCTMIHYEKQGDVVTFDETCAAPQAVTNHGVFQLTGGADFTGTMLTSMQAAGHAVTVDTAYTGKKIGSCAPEAQKAFR